jgi:hypothetical protein
MQFMRKHISDVEILDDLRRVVREVGHTPTLSEYQKLGRYRESRLRRHFGSWNKTLKTIGLKGQPFQARIVKNPPCRFCKGHTWKAGRRAGKQRYLCADCGKGTVVTKREVAERLAKHKKAAQMKEQRERKRINLLEYLNPQPRNLMDKRMLDDLSQFVLLSKAVEISQISKQRIHQLMKQERVVSFQDSTKRLWVYLPSLNYTKRKSGRPRKA